MAKTDRFLIAPINTGLQTDLKPFMIPDDAFAQLNNAYLFRGRVKKRFGSYFFNQSVSSAVAQQYSRLRMQIATTDGAGNAAGIVPGITTVGRIGQMFSIGNQMYTVNAVGTPANMLNTGGGTATFNTTTGAYAITGADAATAVYYYPALPVMGLITYETINVNNEELFGFDTQFAYRYDGTAWERLATETTPGASIWTGQDYQFFWGYNYNGANTQDYYLFVTNFNTPDLMRYWDGAQWNFFNPIFNGAGNTIQTARIIVPFKDRLLLLNTVEFIGSNQSFTARCRFSQNGSPTAADAWREDIPGRGGYIDAPTKEQIITAEFLKDRLIVYFENSTWELAYTGNEILPFRWQQINTELGVESTFSIVPFDKVVLGVGNVGIHACNGANVERIDEKIPDSVFEVANNNEGVLRVYGIRDYFVEMVYWTFPDEVPLTNFPNKVLVYNYRNGSWAFNDDSITCFGYFQKQNGITWAQAKRTWAEATETWSSATLLAQHRQVCAGNQQGFTFIIDPTINTRNSPSLQVTDIQITGVTLNSYFLTITCPLHNLNAGSYIVIENAQGVTNLNNIIVQIESATANTFVIEIDDAFVGVYTGGGTVARISQIDILTKQYNFYLGAGRNFSINKVDFLVDKTQNGELTVDYYTATTSLSNVQQGAVSGALIGDGTLTTAPYALIPLEQQQNQLWHTIYPMADGEFIQLRLYLNDKQIKIPEIAWSDFTLHAMLYYVTPTSSRLQ